MNGLLWFAAHPSTVVLPARKGRCGRSAIRRVIDPSELDESQPEPETLNLASCVECGKWFCDIHSNAVGTNGSACPDCNFSHRNTEYKASNIDKVGLTGVLGAGGLFALYCGSLVIGFGLLALAGVGVYSIKYWSSPPCDPRR